MKIIRLCLLFILVCGIIYPLVTTGIAQLIFQKQSNGSLIYKDNKIIGSELIGQSFSSPKFFHGRISSIDNDASASGSNNYGPSNTEMLERVQKSINKLKKENSDLDVKNIPLDLITNSGSGLDPNISIKAAEFQIPRIAKATGISEEKIKQLVADYKEDRSMGIFGEPRINVLKINLALKDLEK